MPCVDMIATGKRIKAMRVAKGMTVKDIQEIFGFGSANTIYKWQNGESMPTIDNLIILAAMLDVTMDDIVVVDTIDQQCG